jgi:regulatory subunit for Cdc7p protein kinase
MKIWPVDKLQRMMDAMFNTATGEEGSHNETRHGAAAPQAKGRQVDLRKLLDNEKLNDRDYSVASLDLIPLRGYYIYVHDMDETTRPVMVREYAKVTKKEDGKWPQFRISGTGKCPFVEDRDHARRQQQEEQEAQRARKAAVAVPRTRAATAMEEKRALGENNNLARRPSAPSLSVKAEGDKPHEAPNMPPMFGSAQASLRTLPRFIGGEPIASGLQQSNITSAIRSQMISSTSAAPGARAGQSKEVNQLKRKVLEKNVPSANTNSGHSSVMNDMRAALNGDLMQPSRAAKRKAQESLGYVREDSVEAERHARKAAVIRRRKTAEKELKPGYCENCREKFADFDEVCGSRSTGFDVC